MIIWGYTGNITIYTQWEYNGLDNGNIIIIWDSHGNTRVIQWQYGDIIGISCEYNVLCMNIHGYDYFGTPNDGSLFPTISHTE